MARRLAITLALVLAVMAGTARAQDAPAPPTPAAPGQTPAAAPAPARHGLRGFLADVVSDYPAMFSWGSAVTIGAGTAGALAIHPFDDDIRDKATESSTLARHLKGGDQYGNLGVPLALGWWGVSKALGSSRGAAAGRDLLRGEISVSSWTYAIKIATRRTRPNGSSRSFPSGHTSATFAAATVLQEHYGWKVGLPFYAAATYTGVSRLIDNKHWASDVVFGAMLGVTSGRTVTRRVHGHAVTIGPGLTRGGAMIVASVAP